MSYTLGSILQVYIATDIYISMYNIILSYVPLHKYRTILYRLADHILRTSLIIFFKKSQIVFLGLALIVIIKKIEGRRDW